MGHQKKYYEHQKQILSASFLFLLLYEKIEEKRKHEETRPEETKKRRNKAAKTRRNEETKQPRNEETKKRSSQDTKKRRRRNEAAKTRRNEETKQPRHEGTKTRRNEAAKTRRNEETKQPRHEETKAWRKQNTKTRRNEASNYTYLLNIVSETSLVHEMQIRSPKSVIMCFQHMQETLQNNPSYENLSGAQNGSRTFFRFWLYWL